MGLNIDSFVNITNPAKKLLEDTASRLQDKAENYVLDSVGDALSRVGLGSRSRKEILSNLGDAAIAGIASEFFGTFTNQIERITKSDTIKNTGFSEIDEITDQFSDDINADARNSAGAGVNGNKSGDLVYPRDLDTMFIKFAFKEYERPAPHKQGKFEPTDSVFLPIPRNLEEKHDVNIRSSFPLGIAGAVYDSLFNGATTSVTAAAVGAIYNFADNFINNELMAIAEQATGAITNPNLSVVFEGPTLRKHRFEWLLAPNNKQESETIRALINRFRKAALPNFIADTTSVLSYPEMCQVSLHPWSDDAENNHLYKFKTCLIESVSVNYSPDSPVFFPEDSGNAPAFILFSVILSEIEYFTASDYGKARTRSASSIADEVRKHKDTLEQAFENFGVDADTSGSDIQSPADVQAGGEISGNDVVFSFSEGNKTYIKTEDGDWLRSERNVVSGATLFIPMNPSNLSRATRAAASTAEITTDNEPDSNPTKEVRAGEVETIISDGTGKFKKVTRVVE